MVKSMTGYGSAKGSGEGFEVSVELKSVNNRYLDTTVKMPRSFMFAEESVKALVQSHISRGKVDVFIGISALGESESVVTADEALASEYKSAIDGIAARLGIPSNISAYDVCRFPDVLSVEKRDFDRDSAQELLTEIAESALCDYDNMRSREGERLYQDIFDRLDTLEDCVSFVEARSPRTVAEYRDRLYARMQEVLGATGIDENRILLEAAIYADKISVDEETVRLRSHISQLRGLIAGDSPAGRKLDFIVQELNRETNTIGSKCSDGEITKTVLDMKAEIEKIREQVQNIE